MPDIAFDSVPADLFLPGSFVEFSNRLAGQSDPSFKILVLGQRFASGSVAAGVPTLITSDSELIEGYFGRGSMLAEMLKALKAADPWLETWAIALDEDAAGAAAGGSIEFTGQATKAGTVVFYIGGKAVKAGVAAADTADTIAAALAAAITADDTLPVSAAVDGVTTSKVNLTCRWKGESGNDIDLRLGYYGEQLPAGVTAAITAMTGGTTNPDVSTAIAAMGNDWWNWMVMPYTDAANLTALETELTDRWGPMRQIGCRAFAAYRGDSTLSGVTTFGTGRNSPHVSCQDAGNFPTTPWIFAAVNGVVDGSSLRNDPARQLHTLALPGVLGPAKSKQRTDTERNTLLHDGISTATVDSGGVVRIESQISMYQKNTSGLTDRSYLYINTIETLERYRYEQRAMFLQKYPRHKLADDSIDVGPGQPIMQPKLAKQELLALYQDMIDKGWVQDYEAYKASLVVQIDANNPDRLNWYDSPVLINNLRISAGHVEFRKQA